MVEIDRGIHIKKLNYCRELINGKCLKKGEKLPCKFMHKSRMERLFEKGRDQLKKEMDVVEFFKEFREVKATLRMKFQLSKEECDVVGQ